MQSAFTTFASSRFVDQTVVVEALCSCARQLKAQCADVIAVHLFGSLATGTATPRSDADIVVEINNSDLYLRWQVRDVAADVFLTAPVPVDLFVMSSADLAKDRGIAGRVAREGIRLD